MLIETLFLTKQYDEVTALADCSLTVEQAEVFGLLGPNGSGKTTLLRLLLGFLQPTAGSATIDGLDCFAQSLEVHGRLSYLPSEAKLFRRMRGRDVLTFFKDLRPDLDIRRSLNVADRLELDLSRYVGQMSTGMRQKLALAATLAPNVPLIILDEPTASLDPTMRSEVLAIVAELKAEGRTVVFSSHVLSEVEAVCDRVAILRLGNLAHLQVIGELHRQHRISARLTDALPPLPDRLREAVRVRNSDDDHVTIETADELSPLLGWLATLPLDEVRIEPIGLSTVYERYHEMNGR